MLWLWWWLFFVTFNMCEHIKYKWLGGQRQGQPGVEEQGDRWRWDVSLRLEFSSTRTWYVVVIVVDIQVFILSLCLITLRKCVLVVDGTVEDKVKL